MATAAVIGCGDISSIHLDAIAAMDDVELVAVCDTHPERLAATARALDVPAYATHGELLEQARPDVVHICTPHDQHATIAIDCLGRGVDVILEKPVAHTLEAAHRLAEVAERSDARIAVCFQNRYNTTSQAIRGLLDSGELGAVLGASATVMWHRTGDYYRSRPWRGTWAGSGGGLMMNQAIHTVDLLQWFLGEVTAVSGHASTRVLGDVIEVEDTAELVATHAGGQRSVFYATLAHATNAPVTLDVVTEHATLSLGSHLTVTHADGRVDIVEEAVTATGERCYWGASHALLVRDFYDGLGSDGPFWIDPTEALKSLTIVKELYAQSYPAAGPRPEGE